jgi:8-oxo-dGTP pyrophosphatase MutT (NUDIX family)
MPKVYHSYGIIAFCRTDKNLNSAYADAILSNYPTYNLPPGLFDENIKILLIQRRFSIAFTDIVRGKVDTFASKEHIAQNLQRLTQDELGKLQNACFDDLWKLIWWNKKCDIFKRDRDNAYENFRKLNIFGVLDKKKIVPKYTHPEIGFPKGRKNRNEKDLTCAIREWKEETNLVQTDIKRLFKNKRLQTEYTAFNGNTFKITYYLMELDERFLTKHTTDTLEEVYDLFYASYLQSLNLFRDYEHYQLKVFKDAYRLIYDYYHRGVDIESDTEEIDTENDKDLQ